MILTQKSENKEEDTLMNIVALLERLVNSLVEAEERFLINLSAPQQDNCMILFQNF